MNEITPNEEQSKSLGDKAYEILVKRITRLELPPGAVLAEVSLVQDIGIGRTPVREALQRLAMEGLVTHRINRGMFVSEVSFTEVQEIYEFRRIIDSAACRLACARASAVHTDELMKIHQLLLEATNNNDIDAYVGANNEYYKVLGEAARNSFIKETIPRIMNLHLRLWFMISMRLGNWHSIAEAHEVMTHDVAKAIAERDAEAAEHAINFYITQRQSDLQQAMT
ncbi:MAG: GntR family transcriptional regulator [Acidiferrobacterales bacterium]|nr:GntR family transcriptional regulator [Acidiferrobacterales bacterium]